MLQCYKFTLIHRSGKLLGTADALSRLPIGEATEMSPVPVEWNNLINFMDNSPVTSFMVEEETKRDPILSKVFKLVQHGWEFQSDPEFSAFSKRKDELSTQGGCLLWGSRLVIPKKLQGALLKELHSSHAGASRMKELARGYVWWPGLDQDLDNMAASCQECLEIRPMPPKAELHPWEWPSQPWHRLHVDYAGPVSGDYFLNIVDAHSKWVDIYRSGGTSTKETIKYLSHSFATFGLPISICSDNGPCFTSSDFKDFMSKSGVKHITTAVYRPSTNGLAERMVRTFKRALLLSKDPVQLTIDKFLFNYRMTPHTTTGVTPAELMFGRKLRSRLDLLWPSSKVASRVSANQQRQKANHTRKPRVVDLETEDNVLVKNYSKHGASWVPAVVVRQTGPVSYQCRLNSGNLVRRHQDQIQCPRPSPSALQRDTVSNDSAPISLPNGSHDTLGGGSNEPPELPEVALEPPPLGVIPEATLRRSSRTVRPPDRLDL